MPMSRVARPREDCSTVFATNACKLSQFGFQVGPTILAIVPSPNIVQQIQGVNIATCSDLDQLATYLRPVPPVQRGNPHCLCNV